jgi:hypothetical protein
MRSRSPPGDRIGGWRKAADFPRGLVSCGSSPCGSRSKNLSPRFPVRVDEDIAALVPHRSGRALFAHPVLRRTVSLTSRHSERQAAVSLPPPYSGSGCAPRRPATVSNSSHPVRRPCTARSLLPYAFLEGLFQTHSFRSPSVKSSSSSSRFNSGGKLRTALHSIFGEQPVRQLGVEAVRKRKICVNTSCSCRRAPQRLG